MSLPPPCQFGRSSQNKLSGLHKHPNHHHQRSKRFFIARPKRKTRVLFSPLSLYEGSQPSLYQALGKRLAIQAHIDRSKRSFIKTRKRTQTELMQSPSGHSIAWSIPSCDTDRCYIKRRRLPLIYFITATTSFVHTIRLPIPCSFITLVIQLQPLVKSSVVDILRPPPSVLPLCFIRDGRRTIYSLHLFWIPSRN
jgi:hypothetical protein